MNIDKLISIAIKLNMIVGAYTIAFLIADFTNL